MTASEHRIRSSRFVAAFACAITFGCAQVERAPEPAQAPSPPPPAGATPPSPAPPTPTPEIATGTPQRGRISLYGDGFAGRKTASGEPFDPAALTMAHRTMAFGTRVRVTNLENRRSVEVVVNDRGPHTKGRIVDLSRKAAKEIDMIGAGVVRVRLEVLATPKGDAR